MNGRDDAVLLVPGLGFAGFELLLLARRLRRRGFRTAIFHHFPWRGSLARKARAVAVRATGIPHTVHFVAHSMGGNIVLEMLRIAPPANVGRVVLLGSPVNGSAVAARLARGTAGSLLLGQCMRDVVETSFRPPAGFEVGGIAGTRPLGVGRLFGAGPSGDGAVAVEEALHPGMTDTSVLKVAHTGMVFSPRVATLVESYLRRGRFELSSG